MQNHLFLNSVTRPSRYVPGEYNQMPIDQNAAVRWCFAFPDVYEVGMSFTGMNILYGLLNRDERSSCERVFAPWVDAEKRLSELGMKLTSLEHETPLDEFDVLGFSLQHEMNYTNVLTILNSGGLPLLAADRDERHPILIGGGACVFNAEPVADFFEAFVIGDGEEAILDINRLLADMPVHHTDRAQLLHSLAKIPGVYVPSLYKISYNDDGTVAGFKPKYADIPLPVEAQKVQLNGAYVNTSPLVPSGETIHDRAALEVLRGCTRGCRFCQAGYITRPIRERPASELVRLSREMMRTTGYDNLSLLSLSTADHKDLPGIVDGLLDGGWDASLGISLPSLRIDGFDLRVATRLAELHQTGFTFAPEAGTRRLRKAISKDLGDPEIFATLNGVFQRGWQTIKLYFQMGLPTEEYEDLDGLVDLVKRVRNLLVQKVPKKPKLNVSVNPHVPKPFTPFQWFAQDDLETLKEKAKYLRRRMPKGPVKFSYHEPELSVLEGVMARGDRKVAKAIKRAWEIGCRFDDWGETFRYDLWMQAFEETGIDLAFYNQRERGEHEIFPWEVVSCGVVRSYFWLEWQRALKNKATYDCRDRRTCTICDICDEDYRHDLYPPEKIEIASPPLVELSRKGNDSQVMEGTPPPPDDSQNLCGTASEIPAPPEPPQREPQGPTRTLRLGFSKTGVARWLSQLDLQRTLIQTLRRAEMPLATSQGFNPRPKISFAMALPVGPECLAEWIDVELREEVGITDAEIDFLLARLNGVAPPGIGFIEADWIEAGTPSLTESATGLEAEVRWVPETPNIDDMFTSLSEGIERWKGGESLVVERKRPNKPTKRMDLAPFISEIRLQDVEGLPLLSLSLSVDQGRTARPEEVAAALIASDIADPIYMDVRRNRLILADHCVGAL